jgi:mRNA-degrading endonuclease RelE of RelBE toxin-antitoxin system
MTRYTVVWTASAQNELAELWLASAQRAMLTAAVNIIDRDLSLDAGDKGIELSEGLRAYFAPPVRVLYSILADDRLVDVLSVKLL